MVAASRIVAASTLVAGAFAAPARSLLARKDFGGYKVYGGDGTVAQGWPAENDWWSFEELWEANQHILQISCTQYEGSPANNHPEEIAAIKESIIAVAKESGVKEQYLLTAMMQESKGCVRAPTTNYGVRNPGLMQTFNGKGTCNEGGFTDPCPNETIRLMVTEGAGIGLEFGIKQAIEQSKSSGIDKYYKAARIYNSGSIDPSGNLGKGIATHCYSTDMANRLLGWTDQASGCDEGTIGNIGGGAPSTGNPPPPPPTGENPPPATGEPSGPKAEGAAANCKSWYEVKAGDSCSSAGIPLDQLRSLNTGLDANCSNLWVGYNYCIAA